MHELAITQSIVAIAVDASLNRTIALITLKIGELSGVEQEAVRFCFEIVSKGTPAEGARLDIVPVPAVLRCRTCSLDFRLNARWSCPACGSFGGDVLSGREFFVESIEVEEEEGSALGLGQSRE
jgi:hydrogenase nickel incorporation protein HypA/HybF